ncbi:hypothetical protein TVAG_001000, partial [Trichomonas vaginalis G3]
PSLHSSNNDLPIFRSVRLGHLEIFQNLLIYCHNFDPNAEDDFLTIAISHQRYKIIKYIIDKKLVRIKEKHKNLVKSYLSNCDSLEEIETIKKIDPIFSSNYKAQESTKSDANQNESAYVDINQNESTPAETIQNESTSVDINQNESTPAETIQNESTSVDINQNESTSVDINQNESTPADINQNESTPADINQNESTSVDINQNESTSAETIQNESTSVETIQNESIPADINQNESTFSNQTQSQTSDTEQPKSSKSSKNKDSKITIDSWLFKRSKYRKIFFCMTTLIILIFILIH